jgi:S1-C subfamily serine protease
VRTRFLQGFLGVAGCALLGLSSLHAQAPKPGAPSAGDLQVLARDLTLRIESDDDCQTASAVCVSADGYFITKASEWPKGAERKAILPDGAKASTREVHRIEALDLLIGQCQGASGLKAARWAESKGITEGQWLVSMTEGGDRALLGVVSALRRKIPRDGVAMGVRMEEAKSDKGVLIAEVSSESPAEAAGLMADDVLIRVNGQDVSTFKAVKDAIASKQPGDEVEVMYSRDGKEQTAKLRLASRKKALGDWTEDFANGGVSTRTDDFPEVIQHAIPLNPEDMGAPLVALDGSVIGINIARVDRITTFALPTELFWKQVQELIARDRAAPKASAANGLPGR